MDVQHEEFERWMHLLRGDLQGVHARLDALNGRTRVAEERIAVLADRAHEARRSGAMGGGIVAAFAAAFELLRHYFSR